MIKNAFIFILLYGIVSSGCVTDEEDARDRYSLVYPTIDIQNPKYESIERAFHLALGNVYGNIRAYKNVFKEEPVPTLFAGAYYLDPWTRDGTINTWNGAGLLYSEATKNALLAVLTREHDSLFVSGDYWDKVIFGIGSWQQYLYTGDRDFLKMAYEAVRNTVLRMEEVEFTDSLGLFRGAAVYGDGISAYPDIYTNAAQKSTYTWISNIKLWSSFTPEYAAEEGNGLVIHALSTNAVYYQVYRLLAKMEAELGMEINSEWGEKAEAIKAAINKNFWNEDRGSYDYIVDRFGGSDRQEGMGLAYVLLFDIADEAQAEKVLANAYISPAGIPCIYPVFERYAPEPGKFGRHSGTVWPHVQGFWASAAAKYQKANRFTHELLKLTEFANRDGMFMEIYHPETGIPYGGLQEKSSDVWRGWNDRQRQNYLDTVTGRPHPVVETTSQPGQTWSATAYLRMVLLDMIGMEASSEGLYFRPFIPLDFGEITVANIPYRNMLLNITVKGKGSEIAGMKVNDAETNAFFLEAAKSGVQNIEIYLKEN